MDKLSPIEIRVKTLVEAFFADKITHAEFSRELSKEKAKLRPKQRGLHKVKRRGYPKRTPN
jgi:hypothetical protein